jgi:hypothetical protein
MLKVRTIRRKVWIRGYTEPEIQRVQQLGYNRFLLGFKVVDEEVVPGDIDISLGAFGDTGRHWRSKFLNWIPNARGGFAEDFA